MIINMTIIGCFLLWQDMHCFANTLGESAHFHLLVCIALYCKSESRTNKALKRL